jgi:uncharacterized membrane protein
MSDAAAGSRFSPRTLRWVLIGSLALNVLIVGAVLSAVCFGGPPRHGPGGPRGALLLGFADALPSERAEVVRQSVATELPNLEAARRSMRDARATVRAMLSAEPYDQGKLEAALEGIVQGETNEARARTKLFGDTVRKLTPAERVELREWLDKRRPIR